MSNTSTDAQLPRRTLLAQLEAEHVKAERNALLCRGEDVARVNEGMEAAFRVAIGHTIRAFYGVDAAAAYGRDGILPSDDAGVAGAATPSPDCEVVQRRDAAEGILAEVREYVETSDDDGIRTRETVLRILDKAAPQTPMQRMLRLQIERLLDKVRSNQQAAERPARDAS